MLTGEPFSPRITTSMSPSPSRSPARMSCVPPPANDARFTQVPVAEPPPRRGFSYQESPTMTSRYPSPTMSVSQLPLSVEHPASIVCLVHVGYWYHTHGPLAPPTTRSMKPSPSRSPICLAQGKAGLAVSVTIRVKVGAACSSGPLGTSNPKNKLQNGRTPTNRLSNTLRIGDPREVDGRVGGSATQTVKAKPRHGSFAPVTRYYIEPQRRPTASRRRIQRGVVSDLLQRPMLSVCRKRRAVATRRTSQV